MSTELLKILIEVLTGNPLTVALVVGGIICVAIALIGKASGGIEVTGARAFFLGLFGVVLIFTSIVVSWILASEKMSANVAASLTPSAPSTATAVVVPTDTLKPILQTQEPILPTVISPSPIPPTAVLIQPTTQAQTLCYGKCWRYDDNLRTMTWEGNSDGSEDIWQPTGEPIQKIREGYTAIFTTIVPGEIASCILVVNGKSVNNKSYRK